MVEDKKLVTTINHNYFWFSDTIRSRYSGGSNRNCTDNGGILTDAK